MGGFRLGNDLDVRYRILFPAAFSSAVVTEFHFTKSVPTTENELVCLKTSMSSDSDSELVSHRGQRDFSMKYSPLT